MFPYKQLLKQTEGKIVIVLLAVSIFVSFVNLIDSNAKWVRHVKKLCTVMAPVGILLISPSHTAAFSTFIS